MKTAERDKWLREIAAELKRVAKLPIREVPNDAVYNLTMARNFLRGIKYRKVTRAADVPSVTKPE